MQLNVLRVLGISFRLCSSPVESLQFLFYHCPLANDILSWVQSLMFTVSPLRPSLLVTFLWFFGRGTASRSSVFNLPRQCCYVVSSVRVMVWLFQSVQELVFVFIFLCSESLILFVCGVLVFVAVSFVWFGCSCLGFSFHFLMSWFFSGLDFFCLWEDL